MDFMAGLATYNERQGLDDDAQDRVIAAHVESRLVRQQKTGAANLAARQAEVAPMGIKPKTSRFPERNVADKVTKARRVPGPPEPSVGVAVDNGEPARPPQVGLVYVLLGKLRTHNPDVEALARVWFEERKDTFTVRSISPVIDRLRANLDAPAMVGSGPTVDRLNMDAAATRTSYDAYTDIPDGNYALPVEGTDTIHFYRVSRSRDGRYVRVAERASDTLYPVRPWNRAKGVLEDIRTATPHDAAVLFGRTIGSCYRCGRSLTDEVSRAAGIGPDCAGKGMF